MAEPLKATFFTLKHRDRAVLLPATLVMIVLVALIVAAWAALNSRMFALMFELTQLGSGQANEEQALAMFSGMMGLFLSTFLLLIPLYIVVAAYEAACLRWMIRGEAPGLFGLTLNNDTWRVWGVYW
jgi:predicted metal-binding membrane protein